ncbi:MAG: hypothetical protein KKF74_01620 [Nanoarchaeota archaeon]|nr:hypothetical protein [Nanoarchaeota archaeon]
MKRKKAERTILKNKIGSSYPFSSRLTQEERVKLEKAKKLLLPIKEKYKLTFDELEKLAEEELSFPATILNKKLTVLESVVKYLKEEQGVSLRRISNLLGRDERNIWHIYNRTRKKYSKKFVIKKIGLWIPVNIFSNTKLSALEVIVSYLKEEFSLTYHEIAILLKRDDRTIWTVYQRARKKNVKSK